MSEVVIGLLEFACMFGGAVLGLAVGRDLPQHHLSADSKDVIKLAMAIIATLAALVLGLLVSSSKSSFDNQESEFRHATAQLVLLDRTLSMYGPEASRTRDLLRQVAMSRLRQIWPESSSEAVVEKAIGAGSGIEVIQKRILDLPAQGDSQQWARSTALQITSDIATARWLILAQMSSSAQWPFLAILTFWLFVIFVSFGLFAPGNGSVIAALFLSALSVAGSIYLILDMERPYSGLIKISGAPLQLALEELGR